MLSHLAVFSAQGPEAGAFLQGQLTQDVLSMEPGQARAGGYCSAKGRLLGNFIIVQPMPQTWWFITQAQLAPALVKRLKMFVLRAKCTVIERPDLQVNASSATDLAPWQVEVEVAPTGTSEAALSTEGASAASPLVRIGWWGQRGLTVGPADAARAEAPSDQQENLQHPDQAETLAWRHADIQAGWPWIEPATVEQFVPQMINFELLGGVNFRKGCYPGQEVVARSQYRGTLKRRMALYALNGAAPAAGAEIFDPQDPDQPAGVVVNAAMDPHDEARCLLLAEVKLASQVLGDLRLGSPQGPALLQQALPYRIPTESEM